MRTRLIAAFAALLLALIGGILVTGYVEAADERALAGAKTVNVLTVVEPIAAGTPAEALPEFLAAKAVPQSAVATDALTTLDGTTDKVTAVDLVPGEQLLSTRLVNPEELQDVGTVAVPEGMQEVTIQLGADRMVGGRLSAGDTAGFFVSFAGGGEEKPTRTQAVFHKVLITSIQGAPTPPAEEGEASGPPVPGGAMLVTFAGKSADVAKIIYAAEFASIWLSKEPLDASEDGPSVITEDSFQQ